MILNDDFKQALKENNFSAVYSFLNNGHNANSIDNEGLTPLHLTDTKEIAKLLIEHGANVNAKSNKGFTPLHMADNPYTVEYLINVGANVNEKGYLGNTALHISALYGDWNVAKILISNGAKIDVLNEQLMTPLMVAQSKGHNEFIKSLESMSEESNHELADDSLKIPTEGIDSLIAKLITYKNKKNDRIQIGQLRMQEFKSISDEQGIVNEQKTSVNTHKEYVFDVTVEIRANEKELYKRAKIFVQSRSESLKITELPISPVTIITILNFPEKFWPSYIDTYMPIVNRINNINYFYKASPQAWKEILSKNEYFKETWDDYKL